MNDAAVHTSVQVSAQACFSSLGYIPRSALAGSYDMSVFNFWRNQ